MDELEAQVFRSIESGRDRMVRFLQDLIRIDTQVPPGHDYDKVCEVIEDKYRHLGYSTFLYDAPEKYMILSGARHIGLEGPRRNLVARLRGIGKGPTLHISPTQTQPPYRSRGGTAIPSVASSQIPANTARAPSTRVGVTSGAEASATTRVKPQPSYSPSKLSWNLELSSRETSL